MAATKDHGARGEAPKAGATAQGDEKGRAAAGKSQGTAQGKSRGGSGKADKTASGKADEAASGKAASRAAPARAVEGAKAASPPRRTKASAPALSRRAVPDGDEALAMASTVGAGGGRRRALVVPGLGSELGNGQDAPPATLSGLSGPVQRAEFQRLMQRVTTLEGQIQQILRLFPKPPRGNDGSGGDNGGSSGSDGSI